MKQKKDNPELATFTLLNPDFSAGHEQTEGAKGDKEQKTKT
ncbi:hypothetical protein ACDX78_02380 [Virgibacillus oceani]